VISDKKIDSGFCKEKEKEIKYLISSILEIKRQKGKENQDEVPVIKLGRRLVQRSNKKLSEQILDYLIERYYIDHKRLPAKEELIDMMINFLGNIQKTPNFYKLKNEKSQIVFEKSIKNKIGKGKYGQIYKFKLDSSQTKKNEKYLAYKYQISGIPYNINIHFTSAVLLILYGFQPKYYNQFFMEIGSYENKNKQRVFQNILSEGKEVVEKLVIYNAENIVEKNIKWYILFNFTNISDQIHNLMKLLFNNELIKIDLRCLNTEQKHINSNKYIFCLERYRDTFVKYKNEVINELDKLLAIKEEFLINFIKFRTERGCFNVSNEDLANQVGYISSCYKVLKISELELTSFQKIFFESKKNFNNHFEINPTFTWMLFLLFKFYILTKKQYDDYVNMYNNKSKSYEKIAIKIREGNYSFQEQKEEEEIEDDNNIKEAYEEDIKKEEIKNEEIDEESKKEIIKKEVDEYNKDSEIKEGKNENNDIIEIKEIQDKIGNTIGKEEKIEIKEKISKKVKNSFSVKYQNKNTKHDFRLKLNAISCKSSNNIIQECNKKKKSLGKLGRNKKHRHKHKINNIKLRKPKFAINKILFGNIKTENNRFEDISRNNNNLNNNSLFIDNNVSEINSVRSPKKEKKFKKLDLSFNWKKVQGKNINNN